MLWLLLSLATVISLPYDRSANHFSPNGDLLQVSYAERLADKGRTTICAASDEGEIIVCVPSEARDSRLDRTVESKVQRVDDDVWMVCCGSAADSAALVRRSRAYCAQFRDNFGCSPSASGVATYIGDIQHRVTLETGKASCRRASSVVKRCYAFTGERPLAAHALILGFSEERPRRPQIYLSRPSGK
jgi:20S proteasome alpha/beta subunit